MSLAAFLLLPDGFVATMLLVWNKDRPSGWAVEGEEGGEEESDQGVPTEDKAPFMSAHRLRGGYGGPRAEKGLNGLCPPRHDDRTAQSPSRGTSLARLCIFPHSMAV